MKTCVVCCNLFCRLSSVVHTLFPQVEPEALRLLCSTAMVDIAHLLRPDHLKQLAKILEDPEV